MFCAKNRSKKHKIFEKSDNFENENLVLSNELIKVELPP